MAQMMIYEKPVILNKQAHNKLRFAPLKDFSFARTVSLAPLMTVEFSRAAGIYPITPAQISEMQPGIKQGTGHMSTPLQRGMLKSPYHM